MTSRISCLIAVALAAPLLLAPHRLLAAEGSAQLLIRTRAGEVLEGPAEGTLRLEREGKRQALPWKQVLSIRFAAPPTREESARITAGLAVLQGTDRKPQAAAVEELTELGLAALTPLLDSYKDVDGREPKPHYRLFQRLVPGVGDGLDRNADLVRLTDGRVLRGKVIASGLAVRSASGNRQLTEADLRSLAVRQKVVRREVEIHALYHCSQIEFLDTGVVLSDTSKMTEATDGFVRLAFNVDGWTSDPDGLKKPGPNYTTNLTEGFPFGALIGKVGATGQRWYAGRRAEKRDLGKGHLYFAINDNPHWQNNLGSYRMTLKVTDAYDVGDAQ